MPRKPREFIDQGIYHVFNRGNNRKEIFRTEADFHSFLTLLSEAQAKCAIEVFHYCLMTNHYHLLVRTATKEALPRYMHWVQLSYARYFKKQYHTTGHLFEERFRSPRIAQESYYLQCGRYIERNPVKSGQVQTAWDYPYSSASYYALGREDTLLTPNLYYLEMGTTANERQKNYQRFLILEEPYAPMIDNQLVTY
jgi:putative transposase